MVIWEIRNVVTREDGYIAVKYLQTIPHTVSIQGMEYAFVVHHNVCLTWVMPEHLDKMLSVTKECCGGKKHPKYMLAHELDIQHWSA